MELTRSLEELLAHPFYRQWIRARSGRPRRPAFIVTNDGCLVYDGSLDKKGYGRRGKGGNVHRQAWEEVVGPIPDGYEIHHHCSRRDCSRIDHLACLTSEEHAEIEGRPRKLAAEHVQTILLKIENGERHSDIAREFNVVRPYISLIKFGDRWSSVVKPFWSNRGKVPTGRRELRVA